MNPKNCCGTLKWSVLFAKAISVNAIERKRVELLVFVLYLKSIATVVTTFTYIIFVVMLTNQIINLYIQ